MIFLDNASTTEVGEECAAVAVEYMTKKFFNPSAPYHPSVEASKDLRRFRENILRNLKGDGKIIFTSSGTESDNLALFGSKKPHKSRIVVSRSEHPAVMRCAEELKMRGFDVVFAEVDSSARVVPKKFASLIDENTSLVSIMHVNNETGAINDLKKLCSVAKSINPNILFHSDGVQAAGKIAVNLEETGVDMYSVSGHKLHAPRGAGALFLKKNIGIRPLLYGGGQEFNLRSSTENMSAIAALDRALETAAPGRENNERKVREFNDALRKFLLSNGDSYRLISDDDCSPYILSFALKYVKGEVMLHSLEKYNIYIGTGSACSSKKSEKALPNILKLPKEYEKGVLRISFSKNNTLNEIKYFIEKLNLEYSALVKYMRG